MAMSDENAALENLTSILNDNFAPWIKALQITPIEITDKGARFEMPENADLSRQGGIICGQALASLADTVGVLALFAHNDKFRPLTTVDMTTHFMRPTMKGTVEAEVTILSNGRRMATLRVDIRQKGSPKIAAGATCAYAYLDI